MVRWIWPIINFFEAVITLVWSAWWISVALVARWVSRDTRIPLAMARRIWAPLIVWGSGTRVEVIGIEHVDFSRPHLFAVNHQSIIDIPVIFSVLPVNLRFIVKEELRRVPFLGWYIAAMGMVFVHRRERRRSLTQVRQVADLIASGGSVVYFPEGKRSRDGRILPFKTGAFIPAIEAGVPVVPVALAGTARVLPPGTFRVRPGAVRISIGRPMETRGLRKEDRREFANEVRARVTALYENLPLPTPHPPGRPVH
ncbi:MAG: 1-acyl-sn-glycerol-3-phosphate acyltransferase [bacterium]|nr:1-acyl-sn-glycerol-3-phosphate acyltransferase [bacterium]